MISIPVIDKAFDFIQVAFAESSNILDKFKFTGNLNTFSSGRINLWQFCIENSTLLGNDVATTIHYNGINYAGAHNSIVEMTYRYGFLSGIAYTVMIIMVVIYSLKITISNQSKESIFLMAIVPAYVVIAMFEVVFLPYNVGVGIIMLFAISSMFRDNNI